MFFQGQFVRHRSRFAAASSTIKVAKPRRFFTGR